MSDNTAMLEAEAVILRLPADYAPRNQWPIAYGVSHAADLLRRRQDQNANYLTKD